jgi:hypothetical protein
MRYIKLFENFSNKVTDLTKLKLKPVEFKGYKFEFINGEIDDQGSVSSCCGSLPRGNGDSDSSDIGICPDCGDHCEYVDSCETKVSGTLSKDGNKLGTMDVVNSTAAYSGDENDETSFTLDGKEVDTDKETLLGLAQAVIDDKQHWY